MKTTLKLSLLIFISILNINCNNSKKANSSKQLEKIKIITPNEFKEQSKNQTIVDVRTPKEFAQGHIEGAININYFDKSFLEEVSKFDKNKAVFIYCRSGNRSSSASAKMQDLGFEEIIDLKGGIMNWSNNKLEIIK